MAAKKQSNTTVRLRFRQTVSLDGETHQANSYAVVDATDAAWDLVNTGAADLDPAPGVDFGAGVQPFPPEKVTTAPAPVSPMETVAPAVAVQDADLDSHTVADLHDIAKAEGVTGYSAMPKDDLVKAIKKNRK